MLLFKKNKILCREQYNDIKNLAWTHVWFPASGQSTGFIYMWDYKFGDG